MSEFTNDQVRANRAVWLEALRSGRYEQTVGRLRSQDDHYCCLGVYMDIKGNGDWVKREEKGDGEPAQTNWVYVVGAEVYESSLSEQAMDSLGMRTYVFVDGIADMDQAIHLNDECDMSFEGIAEYFENVWSEPDLVT